MEPGTRLHIRILLIATYRVIVPAHPESINESEENENAIEELKNKFLGKKKPIYCEELSASEFLEDFSEEDWNEVIAHLELIRDTFMEGKFLQLPDALDDDDEPDKGRNAFADLGEDKKRLIEVELDKRIIETKFHQALSFIRSSDNLDNLTTARRYKKFVEKTFSNKEQHLSRLLSLLENHNESDNPKLRNNLDESLESKPYQLKEYISDLKGFLSTVERILLPSPTLIDRNYSSLMQPAFLDNSFASANENDDKRNGLKEAEDEKVGATPKQGSSIKSYSTDLQEKSESLREKSRDPLSSCIQESDHASNNNTGKRLTKKKRGVHIEFNDSADDVSSAHTPPHLSSVRKKHKNRKSPATKKHKGKLICMSPGDMSDGIANNSNPSEIRLLQNQRRRKFVQEEDDAICAGLYRFRTEKTCWASTRDYYACFSGKHGNGYRTNIQIKDRARTLEKLRRLIPTLDNEPQTTTAMERKYQVNEENDEINGKTEEV